MTLANQDELVADASPRAQAVGSALVVAGLFVPAIVDGLYRGIGRELPDGFMGLSQGFFALSVTVWFWFYSRRQQISWVMDMGWFLFAGWIFVVPYYVLKREGRSGLLRLGLFCLVWFAAWATGWAVQIWAQVVGWQETY